MLNCFGEGIPKRSPEETQAEIKLKKKNRVEGFQMPLLVLYQKKTLGKIVEKLLDESYNEFLEKPQKELLK